MINRTFAELTIHQKILAFWLGAWIVFYLVCWLIGYRPSNSWLWTCGLIAFYLGGTIWEEKMDELKGRVQELEERLDRLENRP